MGIRSVMGILLALTALGTQASRVEFTVSSNYNPTSSLQWAPIAGFQFGPSWASNLGRDQRNAPYITTNAGAITSTFGTFTFDSLEIGGWPWDNYDIGRTDFDVPLAFYGAAGELVALRSIVLHSDNTFDTFTETIDGVRSILIGSSAFATVSARLGAITFNEPGGQVPEPATLALLLATLPGIALIRRRRA